MSERKTVYLVIQQGAGFTSQTIKREIGSARAQPDGSLSLRLDIHPGLIFSISDRKSDKGIEGMLLLPFSPVAAGEGGRER